MSTQIKICGITSIADAQMAIDAGADYLGLIFVPGSPRCISPDQAKEIASAVHRKVQVVGVFQNADPSDIIAVTKKVPLDLIQLHGQESPEICQALPLPVIKMLPLTLNLNFKRLEPYYPRPQSNIRYLLLEPPKEQADPSLVGSNMMNIFADCPTPPPYFLAGRLTPETVAYAIETFKPYGVDVASGVEQSPGVKDPQKLAAFCQAVKRQHEKEGTSLCKP